MTSVNRDVLPDPIEVRLSKSDRRSIADCSPAKKAEHIVRMYLHQKHGREVNIEHDNNGADLRVSVGCETERIEVKGTKDTGISWGKLKVSSQQCYEALESRAARLYRVVDIDSATPRIYILEYDAHYRLVREPRWRAAAISTKGRTYPLRGARYRYDRPYDAVAEDEWAVDR